MTSEYKVKIYIW